MKLMRRCRLGSPRCCEMDCTARSLPSAYATSPFSANAKSKSCRTARGVGFGWGLDLRRAEPSAAAKGSATPQLRHSRQWPRECGGAWQACAHCRSSTPTPLSPDRRSAHRCPPTAPSAWPGRSPPRCQSSQTAARRKFGGRTWQRSFRRKNIQEQCCCRSMAQRFGSPPASPALPCGGASDAPPCLARSSARRV